MGLCSPAPSALGEGRPPCPGRGCGTPEGHDQETTPLPRRVDRSHPGWDSAQSCALPASEGSCHGGSVASEQGHLSLGRVLASSFSFKTFVERVKQSQSSEEMSADPCPSRPPICQKKPDQCRKVPWPPRTPAPGWGSQSRPPLSSAARKFSLALPEGASLRAPRCPSGPSLGAERGTLSI